VTTVAASPSVLQVDEGEKKPDTGGDAEFQVHGNGIDQPFPARRQGNEQKQHAGQEHAAEHQLPTAAELRHHGEGEIDVEAHARRERDRVVGIEAHDRAARRGGNQVATNTAR
jgi:hypothetical protein